MVNISLTNHHSDTAFKYATVDILTGLVTLSDGRELKDIQALAHEPFTHPLLLEPYTPQSNHHFHYTYDDLNGLLYSAIFVYSVLINTDSPLACQFTIQPSAQFKPTRLTGNLHFSLNYRKTSNSTITLEELKRLISKNLGLPFFFSDALVIHADKLTLEKLPTTVNGDRLYEATPTAMQALTASVDLTCYELRYINPTIGFGIFARTLVKKNTIISIYSGMNVLEPPNTFAYSYTTKLEILNMRTDAEQQGNLTRFINHAPTTAENKNHAVANMETNPYCLHGIGFVVFVTKRNILPGEQLLIDYTPSYFGEIKPFYFKKNGRFMYPKRKIKLEKNKLEHIRSMASEGFQAARRYLWMRWSAIFFVIFTAAMGLNLAMHIT